jgi:hypothetical protein
MRPIRPRPGGAARAARAAADRVEIGETLQRYGVALDERDFALLDRVFLPDARLRYAMPAAEGGEPQRAEGTLEAWKKIFRGFLAPFAWTQHLTSAPLVELDGDRALSTCRLLATHVQRRTGGGHSLWRVYGVYRDRWVRSEAGWRIAEREFRGEHTEGAPLPPAEVELAAAPDPWRGDPAED